MALGFRVRIVDEPVRKAVKLVRATTPATPAAKATPAEVDRTNRERWRGEALAELVGSIVAEAEKRRLTLADAASWVVEASRGAKLVSDYADLGGGELTAGKLARLAAEAVSTAKARTLKSDAARRLEQQLGDLEAISRAAEALAKRHGLKVAYEAHQKAARVIQGGGTLPDALAALRA